MLLDADIVLFANPFTLGLEHSAQRALAMFWKRDKDSVTHLRELTKEQRCEDEWRQRPSPCGMVGPGRGGAAGGVLPLVRHRGRPRAQAELSADDRPHS